MKSQFQIGDRIRIKSLEELRNIGYTDDSGDIFFGEDDIWFVDRMFDLCNAEASIVEDEPVEDFVLLHLANGNTVYLTDFSTQEAKNIARVGLERRRGWHITESMVEPVFCCVADFDFDEFTEMIGGE